MKAAVIGGDVRFAYLAKLLLEKGIDAFAVGLEKAGVDGISHASKAEIRSAEWLILNSPLKTELAEEEICLAEVLHLAGEGKKLVFAGPRPAPALDERLYSTYDLNADEDFLCKNAVLTAEGAIRAAMDATPDALKDARCLVIGWGRIGGALAKMLAALGADVTVASRSEENRRAALACGAGAVDNARLSEILPEMEIIFSTPPSTVLDEALLVRTRPDARIIDLASAPYGVDLDAARKLNRKAWREPGLPGRYCPRSAAKVLAERVLALMKEEGGGSNG